MVERIDLLQILGKNPTLQEGELREGTELTERLRAFGLGRAEYRLAPPGERCKAHVTDTTSHRLSIHLRGA